MILKSKFFLTLWISTLICFLINIYKPINFDATLSRLNSLNSEELKLISHIKSPLIFEIFTNDNIQIEHIKKLITPLLNVNPLLRVKKYNKLYLPNFKDALPTQALIVTYNNKNRMIALDKQLSKEKLINSIYQTLRKEHAWVVFMEDKNNQYSKLSQNLKKRGIYNTVINLKKSKLTAIPDNTQVLVLSELSQVPSPSDIQIIKNYLIKGGNLIWTMGARIDKHWKPLCDYLHLTHISDFINDEKALDYGMPHQHFNVIDKFEQHPFFNHIDKAIVLPNMRGLTVEKNKSWVVTPIMKTHTNTYLEHQPQLKGPFTAGFELTRKVGTKAQSVILIGSHHIWFNSFIHLEGNAQFARNVFEKLILSIPTTLHQEPLTTLQVTPVRPAQLHILLSYYLYLIPLIIILLGIKLQFHRFKHE